MKSNLVKSDQEYKYHLSESFMFDDNGMFRELMSEFSEPSCSAVVLDLSKVTSIDSAGLGMLMLAFESAENAKKKFKIQSPQGQVRKLLEISDFSKIMKIEH